MISFTRAVIESAKNDFRTIAKSRATWQDCFLRLYFPLGTLEISPFFFVFWVFFFCYFCLRALEHSRTQLQINDGVLQGNSLSDSCVFRMLELFWLICVSSG